MSYLSYAAELMELAKQKIYNDRRCPSFKGFWVFLDFPALEQSTNYSASFLLQMSTSTRYKANEGSFWLRWRPKRKCFSSHQRRGKGYHDYNAKAEGASSFTLGRRPSKVRIDVNPE